jgi:hypothetical protein
MIDHLKAVARRVGDEDATGFGIERGMIEVAVQAIGDGDDAKSLERHGDLAD